MDCCSIDDAEFDDALYMGIHNFVVHAHCIYAIYIFGENAMIISAQCYMHKATRSHGGSYNGIHTALLINLDRYFDNNISCASL